MAIIQNLTENPVDGNVAFPTLLVTRRQEGRWQTASVTHAFPGLKGIKQYLDPYRKQRPITVDAHLYDRVSLAALQTDIKTIEGYTLGLIGDLSIDGTAFVLCTFDGLEPLDVERWDPNHGYHRRVRLHWTQRSYT